MRIPICEGAADSKGWGYMAISMATMEISWVFMEYETDQEMGSEVDSHSLVPVRLAFFSLGRKSTTWFLGVFNVNGDGTTLPTNDMWPGVFELFGFQHGTCFGDFRDLFKGIMEM